MADQQAQLANKQLVQEKPVQSVIAPPATTEKMRGALSKNKINFINYPREHLPRHEKVSIRLDIPALTHKDFQKRAAIVTVHRPWKGKTQTKGRVGKVHGYVPTAVLKNAVFNADEDAAHKVFTGKANKSTFAGIDGEYLNHISDDQAHRAALLAHKIHTKKNGKGKWVHVGYNPKAHSYFYNRATGKPIKKAKYAIQVGNQVFAHQPEYGETGHYKFQRKKYAKTQDLPFSNALANSQSANSEATRKLAGRIMQKGGFKGKYKVAKAVGHWPTGSAEGAAHIFHDLPDQNQLHYLASWAGMYTDSPSVLAFHGDNAGKDTLHHLQFKTTDLKQLRMAMKQAGLHIQTIVPGTKGTQVFVYDPLSKNTQRIEQFAGANNAIVRQSKGTGKHIGSDAQDPQTARAKARQHYRQEITNYEAARQSKSPEKANIGDSVSQSSSSGGKKTSPGSGKKGGVNAGSGNRSQPGGAVVRGQFYKPGTFKPSMNYGSK